MTMWVYVIIFMALFVFLCFFLYAITMIRNSKAVTDSAPVCPDTARQWCPDIYASPLIDEELFHAQMPFNERDTSNWPAHRLLIRRLAREQVERQERAWRARGWRRFLDFDRPYIFGLSLDEHNVLVPETATPTVDGVEIVEETVSMMSINRERPGVDEMKQLAKALPSPDRLLFRRLLQLLENFRMRDDNYRDLVVKSQGKQLDKEIIPYEEKSSCPLKSLVIAVARGVLSLVELVRPKHGQESIGANEETLKELRGLLIKGHFGRPAGLLKLMISALATSIRYGPDSEKAGQPTHELVRGVHNSQKDVTFGQEPIDRLIIEIGSGIVDLLECAKQAALGRIENGDEDSTQAFADEDVVMNDAATSQQQQDQSHRAATSARPRQQQNHEAATATPLRQRQHNAATPQPRQRAATPPQSCQYWTGTAAAAAAWPAPDAAQVAAAARGTAAAAAAAAASPPPTSSSFQCDECQRSFATERGMRQHHSMMHKEAAQRRREERAASGAPSRARRSRSRSVVPPRASRAPSAAREVAAGAAAADNQFECDECGRGFATERGMRTHHSRMHKEAAQRLREARAASVAPSRANRARSTSVAPRLARAKSAAPAANAARRTAAPAAPAAHAALAASPTSASLSDRAAASLSRAAGGLQATTPTPPSPKASASPAPTFNSVFAASTLSPATPSAAAAATFNFAFAAAPAATYAVKATCSSNHFLPHVCELCDNKSFETERGLALHHRRMHEDFAVRRQRAASLAPFRARRSRSMSVAPRVERSKSAPATGHPCTECDKEFGSQQGLKAHYTKKHSDDAAKRRRYREFMSPAPPPVKRPRAATVAPDAVDGPRRSILITGKPGRARKTVQILEPNPSSQQYESVHYAS